MQSLKITICDSPYEAPNYHLPEHRGATLIEAVVVLKGTERGNATVDLIFQDEDGQKYIAMATMAIIRSIVTVCNSAEARVNGNDHET